MPGFETFNGGANLDEERSLEQSQIDERALGAKILTQVGFENRQKEIVDSSFAKAQKAKEKLPGKNNQRRNFAYLNRLEKAIEKHGNALEKKLWDASVGKLVIEPENITDAYWKSQEQILRDNGQGRELDDYEKAMLTEEIQNKQYDSAKEWANYLGDEQAPYPMWFKVYAWDGMSKMGVFDKEKGEFKKRDEHSVAPYPHLNQAVLGKVYGAMEDFYHRNTKGEDGEERDKVLDTMVQSGSFNKLYSKFLREQKVAPKTPERTEDVHGEWIEYLPGQEEELAAAAEGTPWCIASPAMGKRYLGTDEYDEYDGYDEYDEYDDGGENKAKFILFHLRDSKTGGLSDNACASIRLGKDGQVAEISGLNEGQALEDSLVPIVEEKVKTLPGGEDFLGAFEDKKRLIALDRKVQAGGELSDGDLDFIFEKNRPIKTMHPDWIGMDPRVADFRLKAVLDGRVKDKSQVNGVLEELSGEQIFKNYRALKKAGFTAEDIFSNLAQGSFKFDFLPEIIKDYGIDMTDIGSMFHSIPYTEIWKNKDSLEKTGISLSEVLMSQTREDRPDNHGIYKISMDDIKAMVKDGVSADRVASMVDAHIVMQNLTDFLQMGMSEKMLEKFCHHQILYFPSDDSSHYYEELSRVENVLVALFEKGKTLNDIANLYGTNYYDYGDERGLVREPNDYYIEKMKDFLRENSYSIGERLRKDGGEHLWDRFDLEMAKLS